MFIEAVFTSAGFPVKALFRGWSLFLARRLDGTAFVIIRVALSSWHGDGNVDVDADVDYVNNVFSSISVLAGLLVGWTL